MGGFYAPGQSYPGSSGLGPTLWFLGVTDDGLTFSESLRLRQVILRSLADSGVTITDSAVGVRVKPRSAADTAITLTDAIRANPGWSKGMVDRALNMTDTIAVALGHTFPVLPPAPKITSVEKLNAMLGDLQPELTEDPIVIATLRAVANELERLQEAAEHLRDGFFPELADDLYGMLSLWEQFFGLPVASPGLTLETRRDLVEAHFRKRLAGAGYDWETALTKAMGTTEYTYREGPLPYTISVRYPFAPGAPNSAVVQSYTREITPAHLTVLAGYTSGFLVGISLVGDLL